MALSLPDFPYDYAALEPTIDEQTMRIHHDKHHQAYVDNANKALDGTEWADKSADEILTGLDALPEEIRAAARNNVGGHANHTLFWEIMGPDGGGAPSGDLATPGGTSSAEEVAQLVPVGTPVVKAFNTTFAPTLVAGEVGGQQLDVLIAGDDEAAKQKVALLVSDGGLRPLDVGPLRGARQLEHLGFLHIAVQQPLGLGFGSAIKVHS